MKRTFLGAFFKKRLGLCLSVFLFTPVFADTIDLAPNHPERYVVVKGDTLWDISAKFLTDPWRWPDVWEFNPQIENPHLIYPGDVIVLTYEDGKPVLKVLKGGESGETKTIKLSPKVRTKKVGKAIPTIPINAIRAFLSKPRIISQREVENSPYIVSTQGNHLVAGAGDQIYARGIPRGKNIRYSIYRTGRVYRNPDARYDDILGHEALYVGVAQVRQFGDPATLTIIDSVREGLIGDKLFPEQDSDINQFFIPHSPDTPVEGNIIEVIDGLARAGQFQTVVINLGEFDGMERGHVLQVLHSGKVIRDVVSADPRDTVQLPESKSGVIMVFRTFDRVSYALVMSAARDLSIRDTVKNP
ncbi:MAG: LysM peptidoglycan-binding domain-containing protein [Gammaproteobacteria bacterium]|nr:LysM peptidoglycan-binding domain-containing protein [Gammaproteobacteria bacterium]